MSGRIVALVVLAFVASAASGAAHAADSTAAASDDAKATSRRHYEVAEAHFRAGRFADALVEYEAGYKAVALPGFLINIAHCHRLMGELRKSRANYRKFLFVEPLSPRRQEIEQVIADLDRAIAEVETGAPTAGASPRAAATNGARARAAAADFWVWSALAGAVVGPTVVSASLTAGGDATHAAMR